MPGEYFGLVVEALEEHIPARSRFCSDAKCNSLTTTQGVDVNPALRIRLFPSRLMRLADRLYRKVWPRLPRFQEKPIEWPIDNDTFRQRVLMAVEKPRANRLL